MLERCKLFEMNEKLLQECNGFSCGDKDIDEFFTQEYEAYIPKIRTRLMYFNLMVFKKGML